MRAVIQRVASARVTVADEVVGEIGLGLLVLLGVAQNDIEADARWLAEKICVLRIFEELKIGLRKVAARSVKVESLSVDSWGLDYVFTGAGQPMLSLPYHYRDARTDRTYAAALQSPTISTAGWIRHNFDAARRESST